MRDRRAQLFVVAGIIVIAIISVLLLANLSPIDRQCAWKFPKIVSCLLSGRETLSAGLIGTGGAIFAGWLAYSAAIEASDRALSEARSAKHRALAEQVETLAQNIDRLKLAKTLGARIEEALLRNPVISVEVTWDNEVFDMIQGIRSIAAQIGSDLSVREKDLLRLADERDAAAQAGG